MINNVLYWFAMGWGRHRCVYSTLPTSSSIQRNPLTPFPATLWDGASANSFTSYTSKIASANSFRCHSYGKGGEGVGVLLLTKYPMRMLARSGHREPKNLSWHPTRIFGLPGPVGVTNHESQDTIHDSRSLRYTFSSHPRTVGKPFPAEALERQ